MRKIREKVKRKLNWHCKQYKICWQIKNVMKKTGLSRGFFYKNPTVRDTLNQAVEQQAGMIDPRREILNMAMEKQIELLNQKVAALSRENKELKRKNEKLQKALRKQDLNFIKNL